MHIDGTIQIVIVLYIIIIILIIIVSRSHNIFFALVLWTPISLSVLLFLFHTDTLSQSVLSVFLCFSPILLIGVSGLGFGTGVKY